MKFLIKIGDKISVLTLFAQNGIYILMLPTPYKDIDHAEVTFAQYHNDVAGLVLRANIGT